MPKRLTPTFLTKEVADLAIQTVLNAVFDVNGGIDILLDRRMCHIDVLVPSTQHDDDRWMPRQIEPLLLHEHSVSPDEWPHGFGLIARSKATELWDGQNDGRTDCQPHLLFSGDTPFWGGVKREGIVVACSGIQPHFDRMIASMIADMCVALAYNAWKISEDNARGVDFLT